MLQGYVGDGPPQRNVSGLVQMIFLYNVYSDFFGGTQPFILNHLYREDGPPTSWGGMEKIDLNDSVKLYKIADISHRDFQ